MSSTHKNLRLVTVVVLILLLGLSEWRNWSLRKMNVDLRVASEGLVAADKKLKEVNELLRGNLDISKASTDKATRLFEAFKPLAWSCNERLNRAGMALARHGDYLGGTLLTEQGAAIAEAKKVLEGTP